MSGLRFSPLIWCISALVATSGGCGDRSECAVDLDCSPYTTCDDGVCRPLDTEVPDSGNESTDVILLGTLELTRELSCDVNDDGLLDNAFSDFAFTNIINDLLTHALERSQRVLTVDLSNVADPDTPQDPDFIALFQEATDCDGTLDDNAQPGEILAFFPSSSSYEMNASLESGLFRAEASSMSVPASELTIVVQNVQVNATIEPGMRRLTDGTVCGVMSIATLAAIPFDLNPSYSILDVFVSPGRWVMSEDIQGIQPDIDLNGDRMVETLITDSDGFVTECLRGGLRVEPEAGESCVAQMMDGYSVTFAIEGFEAVLVESCPL